MCTVVTMKMCSAHPANVQQKHSRHKTGTWRSAAHMQDITSTRAADTQQIYGRRVAEMLQGHLSKCKKQDVLQRENATR